MRVALIHYTYLPTIGGVEIVMQQQARLLADHGHEVTVICSKGRSCDSRIRVVTLTGSNEVGESSDCAEHPTTPAIWHNAVQEIVARQDVVIAHNVCTMPFDLALTETVWRLADTLPQVRFVCWVHDLAAANPDYQLPLDSSPRTLLTQAHPRMEYIAVSELRARQTVNLLHLPPDRCRIIPNGIDPAVTLNLTGRVAAFARRHRLLERDVVLFQPARLLRRKNVELGLQVTSALRSAGRDCAYVATAPPDAQNAASAEYAASIKRLRAELSLESDTLFVDEHFRATERDVASLYALADALFFPSRQEGFGLPLLEAALHRLPIFCPAIEPLCSLLDQGVSLFSPDAAPTHIAGQVMRHLDGCGAMQSRKAVVRRHAWPAIYRNFLAPLLAETNTSLRP